ncbi:NAD-dependent epimerase/dehydratase family protein [Micromonospora phytophila]|uniref:NAD-dependent epimerase/dehydratase family protein n=1 Tax=Micromonospora phytophila TaxID=709888 RepID=UPI00202E3737|nr:NAD-dependent epimerase/dehydratase family protein [Micromonospora phytophila]MCM0675200.1 NAD-dependent epimerase/dehydratase family protein [Micromonospora phytophila]
MRTVLVTGSHGWVGGHLRDLLVRRGDRVVGVGRRPRTASGAERYLRVDLRDARETAAAVDAVRPDVVFHLAATIPQQGASADDVVADAVLATHHVCRALRAAADGGAPPRLVLVGSSAQYGAVPRERNPITEETLPRPLGAYGHAKAAAESVALAMAADGRIEVTAARPFNHVGPGEGSGTVAGALAGRVAEVLAGRRDRVRVADLDAVRDFTNVRDIAAAYLELAETGTTGRIYNVCSGLGVPVRTVLETLLDLAGLDHSVVEVAPGASEVRLQVGSADRLVTETGWKAATPLRDSLRDLLAELTNRPQIDD